MEVKRLSDQWAQEEFILGDKLFLEIPEGSMAPFVIYLSLSLSSERERNLREGKACLGKISSFQSWSHHHRRRRRRLRQIDRFFIPSYPRAARVRSGRDPFLLPHRPSIAAKTADSTFPSPSHNQTIGE